MVLTVAAVFSAILNFRQLKVFHLPEDGVTWVDRGGHIEAIAVEELSPGQRSGLRVGDELQTIAGTPIKSELDVLKVLVALGAWRKTEYRILRHGVPVGISVIISEANTSPVTYHQYAVGAAFLLIGLLVYFRRSTAPKAAHFYVLCLLSFVLCSFHYTGKLNNFDKIIYLGNVAAGLFGPVVFVHFCLTFAPRERPLRRYVIPLLYLPVTLVFCAWIAITSDMIRVNVSLIELRWFMDRLWLALVAIMYLVGVAVLNREYRRVGEPVLREQLKWLRNGVILGVLPFTVFNVVPYVIGEIPGTLMQLAVLSLPLMPLTWAYAIVRHRLMDVDVIFQQGYIYTLATIGLLGGCYALLFSLGKFQELPPSTVVVLILVATVLFQPVRNWIQEQLERYYFYKDRYDYRLTLVEFARELSAETDVQRILHSAADRLIKTLSIHHVAFLLWDESTGGFYPELIMDKDGQDLLASRDVSSLDLSFLATEPDRPYYFFERTRGLLDGATRELPAAVRRTIADLDLTYYLPCRVRGKTIAYLGVSRTLERDFLSSDDVELLFTLAGYLGISVENSLLYQSLQRKAEEVERLKEFSENIVESVNVGILAADFADRVESWNSQMEKLTGLSREQAMGRTLEEIFPAELCVHFGEARQATDVYNVYKFNLRPSAGLLLSGETRESILNLAIAPLVSKDNEQIGRLIIIDDVTNQADLERRLVQADKLSSIGLLAAGVAHEVNTPLAVISTYAQLLTKQVAGDLQKASLAEKIAKQTFRASEIVNSLLNFSRAGAAEFADVELNRVIRETASLIQHQLDKSRVQISLSLAEPLPAIRGNAGKLQQVFLNLLLNARDAMEGGGRLTVTTCVAADGKVRVDVEDSGQGIAPDHLARIYDPFFTTKGAKKGTGLGLSVTYGIVQEHGGTIEVDSQLGRGTCFSLEFPPAPSRAAANPVEPLPVSLAS